MADRMLISNHIRKYGQMSETAFQNFISEMRKFALVFNDEVIYNCLVHPLELQSLVAYHGMGIAERLIKLQDRVRTETYKGGTDGFIKIVNSSKIKEAELWNTMVFLGLNTEEAMYYLGQNPEDLNLLIEFQGSGLVTALQNKINKLQGQL